MTRKPERGRNGFDNGDGPMRRVPWSPQATLNRRQKHTRRRAGGKGGLAPSVQSETRGFEGFGAGVVKIGAASWLCDLGQDETPQVYPTVAGPGRWQPAAVSPASSHRDTGYARSVLLERTAGRGFDSRRLHHHESFAATGRVSA